MTVHRIRLKRPWLQESDESKTVWRRRFGRPSGLQPADRVFLVVDCPLSATIMLNAQALGRVEANVPGRYDVTPMLRPRNEIVLSSEGPAIPAREESPPDAPPGEICLEIHS
jgi:hypothetical protein